MVPLYPGGAKCQSITEENTGRRGSGAPGRREPGRRVRARGASRMRGEAAGAFRLRGRKNPGRAFAVPEKVRFSLIFTEQLRTGRPVRRPISIAYPPKGAAAGNEAQAAAGPEGGIHFPGPDFSPPRVWCAARSGGAAACIAFALPPGQKKPREGICSPGACINRLPDFYWDSPSPASRPLQPDSLPQIHAGEIRRSHAL